MCNEFIKFVRIAMTECANTENTEIQEILERFDCFLTIYETLSIKSTVEEVTVSFKAAQYIENISREFDNREILTEFINCLNAWFATKERTLFYSDEFYRKSCDHLLLKYLFNKNQVSLAIKLYSSCCEKTRFQDVLKITFKRIELYQPILRFVNENKEHLDLIDLQTKLINSQWKFDIKCGRRNTVLSSVKQILSSNYSVNKQLPYLIKVLIQTNDDILKSVICEELFMKMDDRNLLSKDFWLTLLNINITELITICCTHEIFLHKFVSFLIYCGFMMDKRIVWVTNKKSICPEITYEQLVSLFTRLINCNEIIENNIKSRILECNSNSDCLFWNEIYDLLF